MGGWSCALGSVLVVNSPLPTIITAGGIFAGTNVDDIIVLTVLFLSSRASGKPRLWHIWAGQYLGIAALVAVSLLAALGLTIVPDQWVGLLGLVPLGLGVRGLVGAIRAHGTDDDQSPRVATRVVSVAGVTIANGADNISVYTPIFRTIAPSATLVTIAVFAVLVAAWCLVGSWLGSRKKVIAVIQRFGHWIVPAVFMLIGVLIVVESGVIGRLLDLL
jgi:cadmium resistance transport/sequestration family protein